MTTFKTEIHAVVNREQPLPGGLRRHLTYWLCRDRLPSGICTYHIKCHSADRHAGRTVRESVVVSGDLGSDRTQANLVFTLLTSVDVPIAPQRLSSVTSELLWREEMASRRRGDYEQLNLIARTSALNLLAKLEEHVI